MSPDDLCPRARFGPRVSWGPCPVPGYAPYGPAEVVLIEGRFGSWSGLLRLGGLSVSGMPLCVAVRN